LDNHHLFDGGIKVKDPCILSEVARTDLGKTKHVVDEVAKKLGRGCQDNFAINYFTLKFE
jgi:hypothetical protein